MAEIQFIVERLNGDPFRMNMSLVTFDEKSPQELLQVVNDVLAALDSVHAVDLRDEAPDVTVQRIVNFLHVLKYPLPLGDFEAIKGSLLGGDRNLLYPILHYLLSGFQKFQKRAYLAKYLTPVDVPAEFQHDETMQDVMQQNNELREEFKEAHKTYERLRGNTFNPTDLKREIQQLEEERMQLKEKIATLKRRTTDTPGFAALLEATSSLRHEQEEETKLQERMHEQRHAAVMAEKKYADATRRLNETKASVKDDVSAQQLFESADREVRENAEIAERQLPQQLAARNETLLKLQRLLVDPPKTEQDIRAIRGEVQRTETDIDQLNAQIQAAQNAAGDSKLAGYRRQIALVAKKLQMKASEVEDVEHELEELNREIEDREAKINEMAGPKFMGREEFKKYASQLRNKTSKFKRMKQDLNEVRAETVLLQRTVTILKGKDEALANMLATMEAQRGISGYEATQSQLEQVSAANAALDATKGKTLEEISRIVMDIQQVLKDRKSRLAPQIKDLRSVRQKYTELEATYLAQKSKYDSTAAGLETERGQLETECSQLQDECLREESRYHYLNCLSSLADGQLERVRQEARFERGEDRLLRDFKTWRELYANKIQMQEALSKELRKQQKHIKEHETENMAQRTMFADLRTILQAKVRSYQDPRSQMVDDVAQFGAYETMDMGGANVMRIDQ